MNLLSFYHSKKEVINSNVGITIIIRREDELNSEEPEEEEQEEQE